jgi:hypothetical protein
MSINFMGSGVRSSVYNAIPISLTSGQPYTVPSGQWQVLLGPYTAIQWFDPASQIWRNLENTAQVPTVLLSSDGTNYRILNITGTVVGAVITNAGTGYTNGIYLAGTSTGTASSPTCTFTSGSGTVLATGNVIVGGAINTTVTITNGGTGYTKAPILIVSAPPAGGVPATATATLTAGVITGVTVTNQGAGYTAAPTITVVNANGDTIGSGAVLTVNATLVGSGTVTAITIANNGAGMTAVPTISFSPASTTAATAVMCFTALTLTGASGTGNTVGSFPIIAQSTITAGTAILVNPEISTGVFVPRPATGIATTAATTYATAIADGGLHQTATLAQGIVTLGGAAFGTGAYTAASTVGGATDLVYLQPV